MRTWEKAVAEPHDLQVEMQSGGVYNNLTWLGTQSLSFLVVQPAQHVNNQDDDKGLDPVAACSKCTTVNT